MTSWSGVAESGILRKNVVKDKHEDLLVFGYACKLFRDDDKARYVDQGKHLIPWMGDEKLKIDRYDGRGTLSELASFEANREGYDAMRWLGLSESERRLEQLCDEERYYALHNNEQEEEMYKEEELKRLHQKGSEFHYNYDVPTDPENSVESTAAFQEEDEPYVPSNELDVPKDIAVPKTVKENARIEKTAHFISHQGLQMEILIKTKQSDNPQFGFMSQNDPLNKYYRHVLAAIKSGRYKVQGGPAESKQDQDQEQEGPDEHYLHPSLLAPSLQLAPVIPMIPYKPSADCTYSQLVNRIQGTQADAPQPPEETQTQVSYEQQYYQQYYYAAQYYEYYKQMAQGSNPEAESFQYLQNFTPEQLAYAYMQTPNNPYAQIVPNVSQNDITKAPVLYKNDKPEEERKVVRTIKKETSVVTKSLLPLAEYGSDSEEEEERIVKIMKVPPLETQLIVDKMANYVSKNGKDFENIVKSKGDSRFDFLDEKHEFHQYYQLKIRKYKEDEEKTSESEKTEEISNKLKEKKLITPVSFSIKKPKEHETPIEIKSALPVEESDEENPEDQKTNQVIEKVPSDAEEIKPEPEEPVEDDPILEMIDLTEDDEKKDAKRAEDRIKDKLAAAAREKLALASRDRALQLERKKRAAAFLKLKNAERASSPEEDKRRTGEEDAIRIADDSCSEDGEIKKKKKKKSHKRKRSKSRYESRHRDHKKSKKRRKRSKSRSSITSKSP